LEIRFFHGTPPTDILHWGNASWKTSRQLDGASGCHKKSSLHVKSWVEKELPINKVCCVKVPRIKQRARSAVIIAAKLSALSITPHIFSQFNIRQN
jgi:hypothetical protein